MTKTSAAILALVMCSFTIPGAAQESASIVSIKGVISDAAGAPIEGATVILVQGESRPPESATSRRSGAFLLRAAKFERGELKVTAKGFRPEIVKIAGTADEVDIGRLQLKVDCSSPGALCDDFGLGDARPKR